MKGNFFPLILFSISLCLDVNAQIYQGDGAQINKEAAKDTIELKGIVLDSANHSPLPYTTIFFKQKKTGAISNENGDFSIDITGADLNDSLCFQYIGYQTRCISLEQLKTYSVVYLKEEIYDLNETLIFGNAPDAKFIVKQVLKNREKNYQGTTSERQTFIRYREITDFDSFRLNFKNSTIPELDEKTVKLIESKIPKQTTSYTDFLGNIYVTKNQSDSVKLKVDPIRTVSLKEKEIEDLEKFDTLFEHLFITKNENEYWKVKSGVFSQKIENDTVNQVPESDTLGENRRKLEYFNHSIQSRLKYSLLEDKDQWEFLYETGRYNYNLTGGTSFNGEDVYIIDFSPGRNGIYTGRLYISVETYALIRADYEYAPGKTGRDIHLLGIGYTETQYSGSIYFEKKDNNYIARYFSNKSGTTVSVSRNIEIAKKRKRALWDKELMDFDMGLDITLRTESSVEYFILEDKSITQAQFESFTEPAYYDIIYVDRFDDKLWSGYSIIEPTRQMKEYKKLD